MKRFAFFGAVLTMVAGTLSFTSCSNHEVEQWSQEDMTRAKYEQAFIKRFGQPAKDQTWGFGTIGTKVGVRSMSAPVVLSIDAPYDAAWVESYLATATEVNSTNAWDNYDNGTTVSVQWNMKSDGKLQLASDSYDNYINYNYIPDGITEDELKWYGTNNKKIIYACGW